jgi:hypothetical protein
VGAYHAAGSWRGRFRLPEGGYSSGERQSNLEFADHRIATAGFNNDFRIQVAHGENQEGGPTAAPAIVVKAALTSGPSQNFDGESDTTFRVQNVTNYYYEGKHKLQFGGQFRPRWVDTRQQSDFAGVFEFPTWRTLPPASRTSFVWTRVRAPAYGHSTRRSYSQESPGRRR